MNGRKDREKIFQGIVGRKPAATRLFDMLPRTAERTRTVLIRCARGAGKDLFARALHNLSNRKQKPFTAVNCGVLPDTLGGSELFGHKTGAFADARQDKAGRFALAEGGTMLLDEIGDISAAMQVGLLRELRDKTYESLGGNQKQTAKNIGVNTGVIFRTIRPLRLEIQSSDGRTRGWSEQWI